MLFKICSLICFLLITFFIHPTACAVPSTIQNLELDDVTSLWDKFPALIDKIKEAVSRFRCPKGWKRLGGSCYYFSNVTSTSVYVNYTCNYLHSNYSNLMQIRNAIELFYAAHVLARNNLSSLMIEIDPSLLKGKKISEKLINDQGLWKRMKENFREIRVKYQKLKKKIVDRLSLTGLKILRRSKKIKEIPSEEELIYYHTVSDQYHEYDYDHRDFNLTDFIFSNDTIININSSIINHDEYEYDDLDSSDEIDEFEQIENTRGICDDIHWNVLNDTNNSTVFILTKYNMSDKIICSLSDVDIHIKYHHVCEYVLDFCFANIVCGKHGRCLNTLAGFQCSCSFLYGGLLCEKISNSGRQILISIVLILIMMALSVKWIRSSLWFIIRHFIKCCRKFRKKVSKAKPVDNKDDTQHLVIQDKPGDDDKINSITVPPARRATMVEKILDTFLPRTSNPLLSPNKRNFARNIWVGGLSVMFLSLLFIITTTMYYFSFEHNIFTDDEHISINDTIYLVNRCEHISDYRTGNLIFTPFACALIILFSWSIKRDTLCTDMCDGRPGLIPPIEPFRTGNRFTTATVFGILAFEVLKIFEELLFNTGQPLKHGVLIELLERIALVIIIGLRYYPVLASLQLRNIVARFFACLYIIGNVIYTIIREGLCMGFIPLSGQYTAIEEAKLRRELGTWFIIYGLIKNIPHFFLLSYISAELCVRFAYDSIYVPTKKKRSIWSAPIVELDESAYAKYYVTKLFRRKNSQSHINIEQNNNKNKNSDKLIDYQHENERQNQIDQSYIKKFINYIYDFDDDFRFTTIAMCTYTVAVVFLYYLSCTFVFLYVTRTTGHVAFLKFYFESTYNVDLGAFSFKTEIILSATVTAIIYATQLFIGMQNYKKHKLQLYKGFSIDIPSAKDFKTTDIASDSVHYSGFLVGYMAWGFVICFHLILLIAIGIKVLSLQIRNFEMALSIIVPIIVIYLLKLLGMTSAGKFLFIHKIDDQLSFSRKTYAVFVYFSFFADCFLGVASCIIRLIKSTLLNIIFMARLDWSFLGRPLEKLDLGFRAYISYLHMEVRYTNPVMLAFCYTLYDDIVQRRSKHPYADECCIAPSELDNDGDDDDIEIPREDRTNLSKNLPTVRYRRTDITNASIETSYSINESKRTSQIEIESSAISTKDNQKSINTKATQQQIDTISTNEKSQINASTVISEQKRSSAPPVPLRADLTYKDNKNNDEKSVRPTSFPTVEKLILKPQLYVKSAKTVTENRSDDGGLPKLKQSNKKRTKKNRNEDGKRVVDTHDPILNKQEAKDNTSSDYTDDDLTESSQYSRGATSASHDSIEQKTSKEFDHSRNQKSKKTTDQNAYETVLTEAEHLTHETTVYSPPSYDSTTNPTDLHTLRTTSYQQAHDKTPPVTSHRSHKFSAARNRNNTNDDSSHYSEITNDTNPSIVSNPTYSKVTLIGTSSNRSNKQQIVEKQTYNDDNNAKTEDQEEEEEQQERHPLLISQSNSTPNQPIDTLNNDPPDKLKEEEEEKKKEKERIQRRKRSRFRWHFLYIMIKNYHLFDLRKQVHSRLASVLVHLQKNTLVNEQRLIPASSTIEIPESTRPVVGSTEPQAQELFQRLESDVSTPLQQQRPSPLARLMSVPVSTMNDYPPSPAERYIALRAQMFYDANNLQPNTINDQYVPRTPTTVSAAMPHLQAPITTALSNQSLGFPVLADETAQPTISEQKTNLTTLEFQPVPVSNQSTADYPLVGSSIVNSSAAFRTQLSFEQNMTAWRQKETEKLQKKQRYCYVYGESSQQLSTDPISSATILSPKIISAITQQQVPPISSTGQTGRQPTKPPFQFPIPLISDTGQPERQPTISIFPFPMPRSQIRTSESPPKPTIQKLKTPHLSQGAPIPPKRMDCLDEDSQEASDVNKSSKTISALIHRQDSKSSNTDITED